MEENINMEPQEINCEAGRWMRLAQVYVQLWVFMLVFGFYYQRVSEGNRELGLMWEEAFKVCI